jgi:hypothetical protein
MIDRRSLFARLLALPAALVPGRWAAAASAAKPEPANSYRSGCCDRCEGMTDDQARMRRDFYAADAVQRLIDRERDQDFGIPLIATEGDYEIDKTHDPAATAEDFIAELAGRRWCKGENDIAVWRGRRIIAVLEGCEDGTAKVTRFEDIQEDDRYTVSDEVLTGKRF